MMMKMITSFVLLLIMALATPLQAQNPVEVMTGGKAAIAKGKSARVKNKLTKAQDGKSVWGKGQLRTVSFGSYNSTSLKSDARKVKRAASEVKDAHGIITQPAEGVHRFYSRTGVSYYPVEGGMAEQDQYDAVEIVECADGTVYVKDIISAASLGTWVKGTRAGRFLTIPAKQPVYYNEDYQATVSLRWGMLTAEGAVVAADDHAESFTFVLSGDVITLQGTSAGQEGASSYFMGLFWDDDDASLGYGDAETVWELLDIVEKVDELPYMNTFETLDEQYSFSIIDANNDGTTWRYIMNSDGDHYGRYECDSYNAGDDWLISPAIKLEAGQFYHVAFDTRSGGYEERIEMKMGKTRSADGMTESVVEPTIVNWEPNQPLGSRRVVVSESGYYYFGIHAISDADVYRLYADNFIVEAVPMNAPDAITDLQATAVENKLEVNISFTAPTKSIKGDDLSGNMTIDLLRNGEVVHSFENVAPGAAVTYLDNSEDLRMRTYRYQLVARNDDGEGEKSAEVSVFLSVIMEVPYLADFKEDASTLESFVIIDANEDGRTWCYDEYYGTGYIYSSDNNGDDWMVTPGIHLVAGKNYMFELNVLSSGGDYYPERFEVKMGKAATAEGLAQELIAPTDLMISADEGEDYEKVFTVAEDGVYYIGVHAISDADMDHLIINRLSVEDGPSATAPVAPQFEVVADAAGEPKATVTFTAPVEALNGSALTANLTKIVVLRDGKEVGEVEDVAPGSVGSYVDEMTTDDMGFHVYRLAPYNADGIGVKSEKKSVFVGVDIPLAVENLVATDNKTSVSLAWSKVGETGSNERYVNPAKVDYLVYATQWQDGFFGPELTYDESGLIGTVTDQDTFSFDFDTQGEEQGYEFWVVTAKNDAGESEGTVTGLLTGVPYSLPLTEGFADGYTHYFWSYDLDAMNFTLSSDDDGNGIVLLSDEAGTHSFTSGKLNLQGVNEPVLAFDVMGAGVATVNVLGAVDGAEPEEMVLQADIPVSNAEYTTVVVPLSALQNNENARFGISFEITNVSTFDFISGELTEMGDALAIDNIRVGEKSIVTSIDHVANSVATTDRYYDLNGRQLKKNQLTKGIHIVNGKKTMVK